MVRWIILCAWILAASTASSQILNYDLTIHDGVNPAITGNGVFDFSAPAAADGSTPVAGSALLGAVPPDQSIWLMDLVLGASSWRWSAPEALQVGVQTVTGTYVLNFPLAGVVSADYFLDLGNQVGSFTLYTQGFDPNQLPQNPVDEWLVAEAMSLGDGQGNVTGSGCLLRNGEQFATFTENGAVGPTLDLSALPPTTVRFGLRRTTTTPEEAIRNGRALFLPSKQFTVYVSGDFGNGPESLASGVFDLVGHARSREWSMSAQLTSSGQHDELMSLVNFGWPAIVGRALRAPHVWNTEPTLLQASQALDFGPLGSVDLTISVDCAQKFAQFDYDFTNFATQNFFGPIGIYDLYQEEGSKGSAGGFLSSSGDVKSLGVPVATVSGSAQLTPDPGTAGLPDVQTSLSLSNNLVGQLPTLYFVGTATGEIEASTTLSGILDLGGSFLTLSGFATATPTEGEEGTSSYDIVAQLQYDQALPSRSLVLAQLPAITSWMRARAGNSSYPTEFSTLHYSDLTFEYWPQKEDNNGSSEIEVGYDIATVSILSVLDNLDLGLLPTLASKAWIGVDERGSQGEDGDTDEYGCVTVCEEDPNTQEVICSAECDLRYAASTGSLPTKNGDIVFELRNEFLFCLLFSPDEKTVDILATFVMSETEQPTPTVPTGGSILLRAPAPNPSFGASSVRLSLPRSDDARIEVYDLRGRAIRTLFDGRLPAGSHDFRWDGRDLQGNAVAAGNYFLRARVGGESLQRKLVLLR